MADNRVEVTDFASAANEYQSFMLEISDFLGGMSDNDGVFLAAQRGSTFTGRFQNEAGARYGVLKLFFERLKDGGFLEEWYTQANVMSALQALKYECAVTRQVVEEESKRLISAFAVWETQINEMTRAVRSIRTMHPRRSSPRSSEVEDQAFVNEQEETTDSIAGSGDEGKANNEGNDVDLQVLLHEYKRVRKAEDGDDGVVSE